MNSQFLKPLQVGNLLNKFCLTIGMIPTTYLLSLTYEEQILAIGKYLEDTVFPAINNNAEALAEVQKLYSDLKYYVDNYFNDLNVQTEINNKLDEMDENGDLDRIINEEIFSDLEDRIENLENTMENVVLENSTVYNYFNSNFLNNLRNNSNQTILFAGDSLTLGGDPTAQNNFPTVFRNFINDWYSEQNLSAINCGVGGALSQRGLTDFETYLQYNPTTIFWSYGTNDITQNVPLSQIMKNLDDFYKLCIEENIELIIIIPPPNFKNNYRSQGMKMLATVMEAYCKKHGLLYVNAYKYIDNLYQTLTYNNVDLQPDQTHFADYTVLSDAIIHDLIPTVYVQSDNIITNFAFGRQPNRIKTDAQFLSSTSISPFSNGYRIVNDTTQFEFYVICKKPSYVYLNSYARANVGEVTFKIDNTNYNLNAHDANNTSSDATGYMIDIRIPVLLKPRKT